jgi:hypothetical protein
MFFTEALLYYFCSIWFCCSCAAFEARITFHSYFTQSNEQFKGIFHKSSHIFVYSILNSFDLGFPFTHSLSTLQCCILQRVFCSVDQTKESILKVHCNVENACICKCLVEFCMNRETRPLLCDVIKVIRPWGNRSTSQTRWLSHLDSRLVSLQSEKENILLFKSKIFVNHVFQRNVKDENRRWRNWCIQFRNLETYQKFQ